MLFGRDLLADGQDRAGLLTGLASRFVGARRIGRQRRASDAARPLASGDAVARARDALWQPAQLCLCMGQCGAAANDLSPLYLGGMLYFALVASVLAFSLYYRLLRNIGPGPAAYTSVLIPVLAMALSTAFEPMLVAAGCRPRRIRHRRHGFSLSGRR